jgi:hypothetical protein
MASTESGTQVVSNGPRVDSKAKSLEVWPRGTSERGTPKKAAARGKAERLFKEGLRPISAALSITTILAATVANPAKTGP